MPARLAKPNTADANASGALEGRAARHVHGCSEISRADPYGTQGGGMVWPPRGLRSCPPHEIQVLVSPP